METANQRGEFEPLFELERYSSKNERHLAPFFTNLDRSVYVPLGMSPEVIGALCSRTSRAAGDLRTVFLQEYIVPFLNPTRDAQDSDQQWAEKQAYGKELEAFINFLHEHPIEGIFSNPRARSFYSKWLAQYGDDSIAQMAGAHVVFSSLSQLAIKHFEDQRIGLAPIEKSTRYVDYSGKIKGRYRYFVDPGLRELNLEEDYRTAMDGLFSAYSSLVPRLSRWLGKKYPDEKSAVVEKKAFDALRGLLPMSTLSQVAFFGNGQAFEYMISRSARHRLGEVRWAAEAAYEELYKVVPSFLRRLKDPDSRELAESYQEYLAGRAERVAPLAAESIPREPKSASSDDASSDVRLVEYDPDGEAKVVAGMLYSATGAHASWEDTLTAAKAMSTAGRTRVIDQYLAGRSERWQKVGRAFENVYLRYDILMDIGAWRDLHRHRMLSQQRQHFTCAHGYAVPPEVVEAGVEDDYRRPLDEAQAVYEAIAKHDVDVAQYAVPMAFRVRFMQWTNVRECFWEMELRTIPEGHPDYRRVEQEKFRLFEQVYPALAAHMRVNLGDYDFARRGQEEKVQAKLKQLDKMNV